MLIGRVDELRNSKVFGWAFNPENPGEHLVVRVMQGPRVIASGVANILRPDLPDAGIGDGDHAFEVVVPTNITSFQGLMLIAQSTRDGEIALPIASNDDRRLDDLFDVFAARYEEALIAMKAELDRVQQRCDVLESRRGDTATSLPADLDQRLARLESRMEEAEVFFVRIDEMVHKLVDAHKKKGRKRFLGIL
jgi:hypothetical protein